MTIQAANLKLGRSSLRFDLAYLPKMNTLFEAQDATALKPASALPETQSNAADASGSNSGGVGGDDDGMFESMPLPATFSVPGYVLGDVLGEGRHGVVRKAVHVDSGVTVAIKIIATTGVEEDGSTATSLSTSTPSPPSASSSSSPSASSPAPAHAAAAAAEDSAELKVLKQLKHPHVVKLYDVVRQPGYELLILECLQEGELFDYLIKMHNPYGPDGLCNTFVGSPAYSAPEIHENTQYDGTAADVWSIGVILLTILTGSHPFQDANEALKLQRIDEAHVEIPDDVGEEAKDLIKKVIRRNPADRLTVQQIWEHPWVAKGNMDSL
eukprot:gene23524-25308_t